MNRTVTVEVPCSLSPTGKHNLTMKVTYAAKRARAYRFRWRVPPLVKIEKLSGSCRGAATDAAERLGAVTCHRIAGGVRNIIRPGQDFDPIANTEGLRAVEALTHGFGEQLWKRITDGERARAEALRKERERGTLAQVLA